MNTPMLEFLLGYKGTVWHLDQSMHLGYKGTVWPLDQCMHFIVEFSQVFNHTFLFSVAPNGFMQVFDSM